MNITANIQLGFNKRACSMCPSRKNNVALVTPQPGQGIRYNNFEGQMVNSICPSFTE